MDKLKDLKDLLKHEIEDLYSAEQQIIDALPAMIEKAGVPALKKALKNHLQVTRLQKERLEKVQQLLQGNKNESEEPGKVKGFLSSIFGGSGTHKCKGTEGLIQEAEKIMKEDMNPEVLDAAIIASAQKIEHYEICGYGTARAYARELKLTEVEKLLTKTLDEEYEADDLLTAMAVGGGVNRKAETAGKESMQNGRRVAQTNRNSSPAKKVVKKSAPAKKTTQARKKTKSR
jgi:ferritin-like metal-binding protein YciE